MVAQTQSIKSVITCIRESYDDHMTDYRVRNKFMKSSFIAIVIQTQVIIILRIVVVMFFTDIRMHTLTRLLRQ